MTLFELVVGWFHLVALCLIYCYKIIYYASRTAAFNSIQQPFANQAMIGTAVIANVHHGGRVCSSDQIEGERGS